MLLVTAKKKTNNASIKLETYSLETATQLVYVACCFSVCVKQKIMHSVWQF